MEADRRKTILVFALIFFMAWLSVGILGIYRSYDGSNDFDTFYTAGKSVLDKSGIYYVGEYYQMRPNMGPFLYPPVAACFLSVFAFFPMPVAAVMWAGLLLVLFTLSLVLIFNILGVRYEETSDFFKATPPLQRFFLLFVSAVILIDNLAMMQINILVFFLCLLCLVLWKSKRNALAGLVLSAAVLLKLTPILFCLYFVTKKAWRLIFSVVVGILILSVVIPGLIFGLENNRIYHRQWFGRMIKPMVIDLFEKIKPQHNHPRKKSAEEIRHGRMDQLLTDTNQSLPAALSRLLLKGQDQYVIAKRYEGLGVVGGGISREALHFLIAAIRFLGLGVCLYFWLQNKSSPFKIPLDVCLVFLTMTLLSPVTRSHYYVTWIFVYLTLFLIRYRIKDVSQSRFFFWSANAAAFLCLLLAVPYGEAVGMGAWANLIFWIGCIHQFKKSKYLLGTI